MEYSSTAIKNLMDNTQKEAIIFIDPICPHCGGTLVIESINMYANDIKLKYRCRKCDFECPIYYDDEGNPHPLYDGSVYNFLSNFGTPIDQRIKDLVVQITMEVITLVELLSKIKRARRELEDLYTFYINPGESSRSMVSLYYTSSGLSVNGAPIAEVEKEIVDIDTKINVALNTLMKLLAIKEKINATSNLIVPSPFGEDGEITLTVAEILMLKSDVIKKYRTDYIYKLDRDYHKAMNAKVAHQTSAMTEDKIRNYVIAKINSLNIPADDAKNHFKDYSAEYIEANRVEIFDPLMVRDTFETRKKKIEDWYSKIDTILLEFNAKTKIWINLSDEENFWGFYES